MYSLITFYFANSICWSDIWKKIFKERSSKNHCVIDRGAGCYLTLFSYKSVGVSLKI